MSPDPTSDESVEDLARANAESNATLLQLVEGVSRESRQSQRRVELLDASMAQTRRLLIMVGVCTVLLIIVGVINAVNISDARRNAAVTAVTAKNAAATYALLYDCLNQQGECGKRNAVNTKKTLDEVKQYELTVIYCARVNPGADDPDGDAFISCVKRLYPGGPTLTNR